MLMYIIFIVSFFASLECYYVVKVPDESRIERPCCFNDLPCIIKLFRERGWCDKESEFPYKKNKLYIPELEYSLPHFNLSIIQTHAVFEGLTKGKIVELYINQKTGDSVFAIEFQNLVIKGDSLKRIARPLKEDIYITTESYEKYDKVVTSSVIPAGPGRAIIPLIKTRAFVSNLKEYNLGDACIDDIESEEARYVFQHFLENQKLAVEDMFRPEQSLDRAHVMACSYVENIICRLPSKKQC